MKNPRNSITMKKRERDQARILWEGFGNREGARGCLETVLQLAPERETLHQWARAYYDEITGGGKG
jgi:hypothetical protein